MKKKEALDGSIPLVITEENTIKPALYRVIPSREKQIGRRPAPYVPSKSNVRNRPRTEPGHTPFRTITEHVEMIRNSIFHNNSYIAVYGGNQDFKYFLYTQAAVNIMHQVVKIWKPEHSEDNAVFNISTSALSNITRYELIPMLMNEFEGKIALRPIQANSDNIQPQQVVLPSINTIIGNRTEFTPVRGIGDSLINRLRANFWQMSDSVISTLK